MGGKNKRYEIIYKVMETVEEQEEQLKNFYQNKQMAQEFDNEQVKDLIKKLGIDDAEKLIMHFQRSAMTHNKPSEKTMDEIRGLEIEITKVRSELGALKDIVENQKVCDTTVAVEDLKKESKEHVKYSHFWGIVILLCTIIGGILANAYSQVDELERSELAFHKEIENQVNGDKIVQTRIETQLAQIQKDLIEIKRELSK